MKKYLILIAFFAVSISNIAAKVEIPFIDAAKFDTIIDGKKVALYTISNGKVAAQITNYGGFIVGLFAPDKDGNYANLVTGYPTIQSYPRYNIGMVGPALGRFANRIANAQFTLDGETYNVTKNSGQHILHGGTQGFDHTIWTVKSTSKDQLVLTCVLADGLDGFPGNLTTELTYSITSDNGLSISYSASTDKTTVVNLSNHSYFNLNGAGNGDVMGHLLTINADNITETDRSNIPTGGLLPVEGTAFDFRNPVKIGDRQIESRGFMFGPQPEVPEGKVRQYDNNFCLKHTGDKIEKVATLYSPESGRCMEVWNNHPGLQVYTGARRAIALESQMYPDSPNQPTFPSTVLKPGQTYHHTCIYKFSVK